MKRITVLLTAAILISGLSVFGQRFKPGAIVGIATVKPATEEMTDDQFEAFYLKELFPAFNKAFPTVPICLMKGERGKRVGKYAEFWVFESLEHRNKYWPEQGKSTEEAKKAFDNMRELQDRMMKMTKSSFTDYVVL
jgi:hypothetical protein